MSKTSRVQIEVLTTGDGEQSLNRPAAVENTSAPGGGSLPLTVAAGTWTSVAVPAGAKGLLILPGAVADGFICGVVGGGTGFRPDWSKPIFLPFGDASLFDTPNTIVIFSTAGGSLSIQWT